MTLNSTQVAGNGGSQSAGQETLQANEGQTSPSAAALTSEIQDTQHYAGKDVKKLVQDALSADGRAQKDRAEAAEAQAKALAEQLTGLNTQVGTLSQQLEAFRRARDDAEAESIKDDPEALKSLRTKQQHRLREEQLNQQAVTLAAREKAIEADKAEVSRFKAEKEARRIANLPEYKVDSDRLFALVPDGNPERLKLAAKILKESSIAAPVNPNQPNPPKPAGLTIKPASIISVGGSEGNPVQNMLAKAKAKAK